MGNYKDPDFQERKDTAAAAKKALLQKFLEAAEDPKIAQRQAQRVAINEARMVRKAEREAARLKRETELAEELATAAKREAHDRLEAEKAATLLATKNAEREAAITAEKKAERDARYAARKAAKKVRRRGY
jgi:E3 ubiquitin-protein ligase DOA10